MYSLNLKYYLAFALTAEADEQKNVASQNYFECAHYYLYWLFKILLKII
jgi:hypothetical protein